MKTRLLGRRTLLAGAALTPALPAHGQTTLPDKQVQLLVGFVTGGATDNVARKIAQPLEARIGRHITVVSRPGGSGAAPAELLRKDGGEGRLLAFMPSTTLVSTLLPGAAFDPVADLTPITITGTWPLGLAVSPTLGIRTFEEYVTWVKADDPKRRKLGSTASDGFIQIFGAVIGKEIGAAFETHSYRSVNPMVNDLKDGRLPSAATGLVSLMEHHRGGRLRLVMITAPRRLAALPNVPTARELGYPGLEDLEWFALFASAKTSPALIKEWNRQIVSTMADASLGAELAEFGMTTETSTPEEARDRVASHLAMWRERMLKAGMTPAN